MSLLGLDINASRLRAVNGPLGDYPQNMVVDPPRNELALVVSIQARTPAVGSRDCNGAGKRRTRFGKTSCRVSVRR